jgi:SAM-dependent methyltransferase
MAYLMAEQPSELERLRLQSRVWEPAGEQLLAALDRGSGRCALEIGCGAMGWLGVLSRWVGAAGEVVGTDLDEKMLAAARAFCAEQSLSQVQLLRDDVFASALPPASFDLVHLRFQLAPLGRAAEQVAIARALAKPGGWIVLEEPDAGSWRENPLAPATAHLRALIVEAFARGGGDFNAGRRLPEYLRAVGVEPSLRCACLPLEPGHPYMHLPVQFATSLGPRLRGLLPEGELDRLLEAARRELTEPGRWGMTFTLVQAWGRTPVATGGEAPAA